MQPINAAPFTNYEGINDQSQAATTQAPQQYPTHLPLFPLYTPWGPTDPVVVDGTALTSLYGSDVLNVRGAWYNMASFFAQTCLGQGNQVMIQRLIPADAGPKARILLSLDIVADSVQQYQRNADGTYLLDASGNKQPITGAGATLQGYQAKWVLNSWSTYPSDKIFETFGTVASRVGSLTASTGGAQSTLYPILEFEATFVGSKGNNLGLRLIAPTTNDPAAPLSAAQVARLGAYVFRMQFLNRASNISSPTVIQTQSGEQWSDFTLLPKAYDTATNQDLDINDVVTNNYSQHGIPGNVPVYGPFENMFVYRDNLTTILEMIGSSEAPNGLLGGTTFDPATQTYLVNPFTATDPNGVPYYTLQLANAAAGGLIFSSNSSMFATGASDGTMTDASYDTDVAAFYDALPTSQLVDEAKYPFSIIYDTGLSLETKYKIAPILAARQDVAAVLTTQDLQLPQNTADQDSSTATALAAFFGNFPESTIYGTAACRATVVGGSGYLLSAYTWTKLCPLSIQFAKTFSAYMGAGNGFWNSAVPPDENPQNVVTMFRSTNATWKSALARANDWSSGLVWIENFDPNTQYFPALASIYANDTSILKGFMNVLIACDLVKIAFATRRYLSGISRLTDAQFIDRSNRLIQQKVKGRYDGRVKVVPDTYYSTTDQKNGYSWSCNITMYGNNMRTVGTFTITSRRASELPASAQ